jgi:hypothetical protein
LIQKRGQKSQSGIIRPAGKNLDRIKTKPSRLQASPPKSSQKTKGPPRASPTNETVTLDRIDQEKLGNPTHHVKNPTHQNQTILPVK